MLVDPWIIYDAYDIAIPNREARYVVMFDKYGL
jgi:hypothetical protein